VHRSAFEWRQWAGEAVVFVHATGDTHALSADASALMSAMLKQDTEPRSAAQWLDVAGYDGAADHDAGALMAHLESIGLVQRHPP